jgi:hypothetical protein
MRICQARNRIPRVIPRDIATMSNLQVAAEASLSSDAFLWGLDLFNHG